jgi:hypothetical protein
MYIVPIAWIYVALMMAVAEASNSNGSVLGAIITFLLYGVAPVALLMYLMGTPGRKRAIRAREAKEQASVLAIDREPDPLEPASHQPDAGRHTPAAAEGDVISPVRKEP